MQCVPYRIVSFSKLAKHIYQALLIPATDEIITYKPGQYLQIFLNDWEPRPFSIANAPLRNHMIELHIQHIPGNDYTASLLKTIKENKILEFSGPYGKCVYSKKQDKPIILLAGGTGFAPIKAIIEQALLENDARSLHLYWGARTISELYDHGLATEWATTISNFSYTPVLEHPPEDWSDQQGLVHNTVANDHDDLSNFQVYAAGPYGMIHAALKSFVEKGLDPQFFYSDAIDSKNVTTRSAI